MVSGSCNVVVADRCPIRCHEYMAVAQAALMFSADTITVWSP